MRFVLSGAEVPVLDRVLRCRCRPAFFLRSPATGMASLADRLPTDGLAWLDNSAAPCQTTLLSPDADIAFEFLRAGSIPARSRFELPLFDAFGFRHGSAAQIRERGLAASDIVGASFRCYVVESHVSDLLRCVGSSSASRPHGCLGVEVQTPHQFCGLVGRFIFMRSCVRRPRGDVLKSCDGAILAAPAAASGIQLAAIEAILCGRTAPLRRACRMGGRANGGATRLVRLASGQQSRRLVWRKLGPACGPALLLFVMHGAKPKPRKMARV